MATMVNVDVGPVVLHHGMTPANMCSQQADGVVLILHSTRGVTAPTFFFRSKLMLVDVFTHEKLWSEST